MEESSTYQAIMRKGQVIGEQIGRQEGEQQGRTEEARRMLTLVGTKRFGAADEATRTRIEALTTREEIEGLVDRLFDVENWSELFAA